MKDREPCDLLQPETKSQEHLTSQEVQLDFPLLLNNPSTDALSLDELWSSQEEALFKSEQRCLRPAKASQILRLILLILNVILLSSLDILDPLSPNTIPLDSNARSYS